MDTASDSIGESKPVCQCASKSSVQRWLPGFPIALCMLMSLSSIAACLLMSLKTYQLENRMQMDKGSTFTPPRATCLNEDGTLIPELGTSIGRLVEEKVVVLMPKLRTARDLGQECSCPPGPPGKRGRMGRRGETGK
ncbi:col23a1 [Pungitius sinensis]